VLYADVRRALLPGLFHYNLSIQQEEWLMVILIKELAFKDGRYSLVYPGFIFFMGKEHFQFALISIVVVM
jgi:hypothetical protein